MTETNPLKQILIGLGFIEVQPKLWLQEQGNIQLYHDYRKGTRKSYGYQNDKQLPRDEIVTLPGYRFIKEAEIKLEERMNG